MPTSTFSTQLRVLFLYQNSNKEKENKTMAVIIKLNGVTIGATTMTPSEIRNAENAGFTILRNGKEK